MSLPAALSERTLSALTEALGLAVAEDLPLTGPMSPEPAGRLRVLRGGPVDKAVTVSLVVPAIGLDSHMLFAFTPADSAVPHFTLDAVRSPDHHAMHLDLIPRADLAVHLDYLDACFLPLTGPLEHAWTIDGLSPAAVGPRQRAMMSPWMVVCRATEQAFAALDGTVDAYLAHWLSLVGTGVPGVGGDPAARDRDQRANLFSPEVDPVWHQVARLLGEEQAERVRGELVA
ncbi:hypothetical protein [Planomonospora venezuelensis]|uniref:Red chlorophyll catabolite reductase (RCC reductase) n=1 Tax=Planomonospora venezuelensis TaxID=1999 RepID=A0A841DDZ4_PLAVE|nr:hypothetical protein [Planomonospora venezuelensis]MBB5966518.1 hypothetical protein [Planomonospora venezuelensis]GIN02304.1 hypothetical protein Pve01_39620 [Planomonospora venezuelensis]